MLSNRRLLTGYFKAKGQHGLVIGYVYPIHSVPDGAGVIEADEIRKGKVLAQLGRVDRISKEVVPLASLVKRERISPPAGRRVTLGQQKFNDWTQVVGARVAAGTVLGSLSSYQ